MTVTYTIHTYEGQTCICKWVDGKHEAALGGHPTSPRWIEYQEWLAEGNEPTPVDSE